MLLPILHDHIIPYHHSDIRVTLNTLCPKCEVILQSKNTMWTEVQNGILKCITVLRTKLLFVTTRLWWDRIRFLVSKEPEPGRLKMKVYNINYRVISLRALSLPKPCKYNWRDGISKSMTIEQTVLSLPPSNIKTLDVKVMGPKKKALQGRIVDTVGLW